MKRKSSTVPSRIYTYGALAPRDPAERAAVNEQFFRAKRYRNRLVEIERQRRSGYAAAVAKCPYSANGALVAEVARLERVLADVRQEIGVAKANRHLTGKKNPQIVDLKAKAKAIKDELRIARRKRAEDSLGKDDASVIRRAGESVPEASRKDFSEALKKHLNDGAVDELLELLATRDNDICRRAAIHVAAGRERIVAVAAANAEANVAIKLLRNSDAAPYWGSYLLAEKEMEAARKSGGEPAFSNFDNCRIGIQLQGSPRVTELFSGNDTRLRIEPLADPAAWGRNTPRGKAVRSKFSMRIGSTDKGHPLWATFDVVLHRPMPADAVAKWAWVRRMRVGADWRYELQITIESETFAPSRPEGQRGAVAIDIGWRECPESLRVAMLYDDEGHTEEINIPQSVVRRLEHVSSLQSTIKVNHDNTVAMLSGWVKDSDVDRQGAFCRLLAESETRRNDGESDEVFVARVEPWSVAASCARLAKWESPKHMTRLYHRWCHHRFAGDVDMFTVIEGWARQHRHLWRWASHERNKALACRRDFYRTATRRLAQRYKTIVLEHFDMRKVARRPELEETDRNPNSAHNRHAVALSEFRTLLVGHRLGGVGGYCEQFANEVIWRDPANTTKDCHACGHRETWNQAKELFHTCSNCGIRWDQDVNACKNLLDGPRDDGGASGDVVNAVRPNSQKAKVNDSKPFAGIGSDHGDRHRGSLAI